MSILKCLILVVMSLTCSQVFAADYPFYCRGKLQVSGHLKQYHVSVKKNTKQAGSKGQYLSVGTCAWKDRAIGSSEGNDFYLHFSTWEASHMPVLANCMADSSCVVMFYAHTEPATRRFIIADNKFTAFYPNFIK